MCEGSETMHFARDELERKYTIRDSVSSFGKRHMGERRKRIGYRGLWERFNDHKPRLYIRTHTYRAAGVPQQGDNDHIDVSLCELPHREIGRWIASSRSATATDTIQ